MSKKKISKESKAIIDAIVRTTRATNITQIMPWVDYESLNKYKSRRVK